MRWQLLFALSVACDDGYICRGAIADYCHTCSCDEDGTRHCTDTCVEAGLPDAQGACAPSGGCPSGPLCNGVCCNEGEMCSDGQCTCAGSPPCTNGNVCATSGPAMHQCGSVCCGSNGMLCPL